MKDSPCVTCPEYPTCGGSTCANWRSWFHEIWSHWREYYLGIKEKTDAE